MIKNKKSHSQITLIYLGLVEVVNHPLCKDSFRGFTKLNLHNIIWMLNIIVARLNQHSQDLSTVHLSHKVTEKPLMFYDEPITTFHTKQIA